MESIEFSAGSVERFKEFVKSYQESDKVALISHTDVDGIVSAKVVSRFFDYELLKFVGYDEISDDLVAELKEKGINRVVMTDLSIDDVGVVERISEFAEVLVIDHHLFEKDFNSDKIVFMNAQGNCATYLSYYLFSMVEDVSKLDWLVACACVADFMYFKNQDWMKGVYSKYGEEFDSSDSGIRKGKFWDVQYELNLALIYFKDDLMKVFEGVGEGVFDLGDLDEGSSEVREEIDSIVDGFERDKEVFGDVYYYEIAPRFSVTSMVSTIVSVRNPHNTILIGKVKDDGFQISARRQDKKKNMSELLKELVAGFEGSNAGGHVPAAGARILLKDKEEFKKRVEGLG